MSTNYNGIGRNTLCLFLKFTIFCFVVLFLAATNKLLAQATLSSDQQDYVPGTTATLTGSGFQPGETAVLQVLHYDGTSDGGADHQSWEVTADASGNFVTTWHVCEDDCINSSLKATAVAQLSGTHAETVFTDANWTISPSSGIFTEYENLCGGVQKEFFFTIQQTNLTGSNFANGRFRIKFPNPNSVVSASVVSVSASKNWNISVTPVTNSPGNNGDYVCLNASQSVDVLANGQTINFKLVVNIQNNISPLFSINGFSNTFVANPVCQPTNLQTANTTPPNIRVTSLSPEFTQCPSNISANTNPGLCNAVVNYNSTVTGTIPLVSYAFTEATTATGSGTGSGSVFNKGTTHVTITATNLCAAKTCSFDVTVSDNQAPVAPVLPNVTGECSATVTAPVAIDNCVGSVTGTTSDPTSYSVQGTYTVHWSFNDGNGNISTANQTVVVDDITAPVAPSLETVTGECSATVTAPVAIGNCVGPVTGTTIDPTSYSAQGTYNVHWSFNDGNGNISTANQTVTVADITAPVAPSLETVTGECSATVTAPVATDNCVGSVTGTTSDPTSYNTQGTHVIHWSFDDGNGNISTANQTVVIKDDIPPVINCPPNIYLSACQNKAIWSAPTATDNCSVTVVQTAGPASGSTFDNGTTTTITYTATDAGGNSVSCSFTVTRAATLTANCNNTNPQLYFGYAGDQTATINITPGGGTGPYTVSISMSRPLNCNVITSAGDEIWSSGAGTTSSSGTACPVSGNGLVPVSTATGVTTSYSVNVTLMADADIIATVTDANGCVTTCTSHIKAEDVRCFAGKSGIAKVTLCHRTGSSSNPCVTICVDESAVAEHLAHGDFLGKCTTDCIAPVNNSNSSSGITLAPSSQGKLLTATISNNPNAGSGEFILTMQSNSTEPVQIMVTNVYGARVLSTKAVASQVYRFGSHFSSGMYMVEIRQGKEVRRFKVIKES